MVDINLNNSKRLLLNCNRQKKLVSQQTRNFLIPIFFHQLLCTLFFVGNGVCLFAGIVREI